MQKMVCVGKSEQCGGMSTVQQGTLQRLEVDQTSTSAERSDRVHVQDPSAVVNVIQSRVSRSSNPFSIDRILQPQSSPAAKPRSAEVQDRGSDVAVWTTALQQSLISHHRYQSVWSSRWPSNCISTAQQLGYPAVNNYVTGTREAIMIHSVSKEKKDCCLFNLL